MTTKRNLERRLDDVDGGVDYPDASIAQILSSETYELVDADRRIIRLDWGLFYSPPVPPAVLDDE